MGDENRSRKKTINTLTTKINRLKDRLQEKEIKFLTYIGSFIRKSTVHITFKGSYRGNGAITRWSITFAWRQWFCPTSSLAFELSWLDDVTTFWRVTDVLPLIYSTAIWRKGDFTTQKFHFLGGRWLDFSNIWYICYSKCINSRYCCKKVLRNDTFFVTVPL